MKRYQQGNHNTNLDHLIWEERYHPNERHNDPRSSFQPPRGPRYSHERTNTEFERRQNPRNKPRKDSHYGNANRSNPPPPHRCIDPGFVMKTRRLKEYLTRSLNAALSQIEQWYPEEGEDEMDWQHEATILVKQPQEPDRVWVEQPQPAESISPNVLEVGVPPRGSFLEDVRPAELDGGEDESRARACRDEFFSKERSAGFPGMLVADSDVV